MVLTPSLWPGSALRTAAGRSQSVHRVSNRPLPERAPVPFSSSARKKKACEQYIRVQCDSRGTAETQTTVEQLSARIPTAEARACLRLALLPCGRGQAVVVSAVAEGSSAAQAGVRRGMKLTAISDPIRREEVWELRERPSLRYVRDVMRMRSAEFIEMCFTVDQTLLDTLNASEGLLNLTSSSSSSTPSSSIDSLDSVLGSVSDSSDTVAERLQQQFEQAQATADQQTAVQQRQQRRKEYMEQVGQRNDNTFVAIAASAFLLPAAVILLVAYTSGYLDNLYSDSLTNLR